MEPKWIGAILIIAGCGGFGAALAANYKRSERYLYQLVRMVEQMENILQYQLTPLPELCRQVSRECSGVLKAVMQNLARELDWQTAPDAYSCMRTALNRTGDVPPILNRLLLHLGRSLGQFNLPGQVRELNAVRKLCEHEIAKMETRRDVRLRNFQTLALCAGVALVILFI